MRPDFEPDPGSDPVKQPEPPDPLCQDPSGHAWLDAARVFQPPCPHAGLAAIAVLSDAGLRALRRSGHAAIAAACVPSVAPARVRFVDPTAAIDIASCAETAGTPMEAPASSAANTRACEMNFEIFWPIVSPYPAICMASIEMSMFCMRPGRHFGAPRLLLGF